MRPLLHAERRDHPCVDNVVRGQDDTDLLVHRDDDFVVDFDQVVLAAWRGWRFDWVATYTLPLKSAVFAPELRHEQRRAIEPKCQRDAQLIALGIVHERVGLVLPAAGSVEAEDPEVGARDEIPHIPGAHRHERSNQSQHPAPVVD